MLPIIISSKDVLSSVAEISTYLSKTAPVIHIMEKYPTVLII